MLTSSYKDWLLMKRIALLQKIVKQIGVPVEHLSVQGATIKGRRIKTSYLSAGAGKPILLLHGGDAGAGSIRWYPVIGPLSTCFRVIVPDMLGYGESDKPFASYDRSFFSAWLKNYLDTLGLKKVSLVGHSVGGAIASQFTLDHPEYIEQLVLVNAAGLGEGTQRIPARIKVRMIWQNLFPSCAASRWFLEHYGLFNARMINETMLDIEEYGCEVIRMSGGRRVFWLGRGRVIDPIPLERLGQITQPTLLVWGEEDINFPPAIARLAMKMMKDTQLCLIPRAGHNCFYDQPDMFNDILKRFLMEDNSRV